MGSGADVYINTSMLVFYVLFPVFIIYLTQRFSIADKIGAPIIAYLTGIFLGNIGVIPETANSMQEWFMNLTVPLAIPLMLFSIDLKKWSRLAGKTFLSLLFILISVIIVTFIGFLIFKDAIGEETHKVAGMLIGVYSGGTPNLTAIGLSLRVEEHILVLTNTSDILASAPWIVLIMAVGQRLFNLFLPKFKSAEENNKDENIATDMHKGVDINSYEGFFKRKTFLPLMLALLASIVIFGASAGVYSAVPEDFNMAAMMLTITTLGIAASFIKRIRYIDKSFQLGQYFILVFCIVVGSKANLKEVVYGAPHIIAYTFMVVYGSWLLHLLFSFIFRIDTDTTIITSVSAIYSPPFVPVVAAALKNKEIVLSGIAAGTIGWAIGNYLGVTIAFLLKEYFM